LGPRCRAGVDHPAGREVVDQATARRRELIMEILARMPAGLQREAAEAPRAFAAAAARCPVNGGRRRSR
jgi:hypothetical protein